jgi:hypothetical protein
MAIVFLARDVALDRPVAIKMLPEARAYDPELRERFLREARTSAKLSHPNIVPIHLVESHHDLVYFVMGFVDGETLGQRVRRAGPLPARQVTRIVQEVAWALAYAHGRGVVHRDVKPDNILIDKDSGRAMVTDFGIASVLGVGASHTGEIVGTAHYMSPEQATGQAVDGRSDLFSLGITAFYALTGTLPFDGPHVHAIVTRIVSTPAPSLAIERPGVPAMLANAVDRCLAKRPDARFESGEQLAAAVGAAVVSNDVAPQLRYFLKACEGLDLSYSYLMVAGVVAPTVWDAMAAHRATGIGMVYLLLTPVLSGPAMVVFAARQVIKAGLGVADVRRAFERQLDVRREEAESISAGGDTVERTEVRFRRWLWMGHLGAAGMLASTIAGRVLALPAGPVHAIVILTGALGGLGYLGAIGVGAHLRHRAKGTARARVNIGLTERLLRTRFADWFFRAAGIGIKVHAQNAPPPRERTEVLIASEVAELMSRLPRELQDRFADVPNVMRRLEAEADQLRRRQAELSSSTTVDAPGEASRIGERLATAVAALESIRLDLLRLDAGRAAPDNFTADLVKAREIGDAVDAKLRARPDFSERP